MNSNTVYMCTYKTRFAIGRGEGGRGRGELNLSWGEAESSSSVIVGAVHYLTIILSYGEVS